MKSDLTCSFKILDQVDTLVYAFSTRQSEGGISTGPFSRLNMGNYNFDKRENIDHNRRFFLNALNIDPKSVVYPGQIHSATARSVTLPGVYPDTDALVTNRTNLYLSIQTADCYPVFLVEPDSKTIALIHAGWRGSIKGIIKNTLDLMITGYASNPAKIIAVIGPGLKKECFEVRDDVYRQFPEKYWLPHKEPEKKYLDLSAFIKEHLIQSGLKDGQIEISDLCSKCREDLFYSHRRDGEKSGRMFGLLGICR